MIISFFCPKSKLKSSLELKILFRNLKYNNEVIVIIGLSKNKSVLTYIIFMNNIKIPNKNPTTAKPPSIERILFLSIFVKIYPHMISVNIIRYGTNSLIEFII